MFPRPSCGIWVLGLLFHFLSRTILLLFWDLIIPFHVVDLITVVHIIQGTELFHFSLGSVGRTPRAVLAEFLWLRPRGVGVLWLYSLGGILVAVW
jgi:hypothetical protein